MTVALVRFVVLDEQGEALVDETVPCEVDPLFGIEKGMNVFGRELRLRFEFDPPLTPAIANSTD